MAHMRIDDEVYQKIKFLAKSNGVSASKYVESIIDGEIERPQSPLAENPAQTKLPLEMPKIEPEKLQFKPVRTKSHIYKEIMALKAEEEDKLKYCQDPETSDEIRKEYQGLAQPLWAEFNELEV